MINKIRNWSTVLLSIMLVIVTCSIAVDAKPKDDEKQVKNVIFLIADGANAAHFTLSRWYNGGGSLDMDEWICGLLRTYSANTPLTDSAPAATAFATGFKSYTGFVGVLPETASMLDIDPQLRTNAETGFVGVLPGQASMWGVDPKLDTDEESRPLVTVLEAAKLAGKATGIVSTSEINHTTPAAFSAHHIRRKIKDDESVIEQQVYNDIDVVLASGAIFLRPEIRTDREDLMAVLRQKSYQFVRTREEMLGSESSKLWGLFAEQNTSYDLDRTAEEPSLGEMTAKAIAILSRNQKGFFLMVEGAKIDWASHQNEPVAAITEVLAFNRAVKSAIDFARQDGNTAVIVAVDHGTGGIMIGDETVMRMGTAPASVFVDSLKRAKHTAEGVEKALLATADMSAGAISRFILEEYGLELSSAELEIVQGYFSGRLKDQYGLAAIIGPMLSRIAHLRWTTTSHTGEDVPYAIYHPRGYRLTGIIQNTAIAWYIDEILNLKLKEWNKILYLSAQKAFMEKGAITTVEEPSPGNLVLVVKKGAQILRLLANKNLAEVNGQTKTLHSLIVFNGKAFFVPREALDLIK
jgi:alkaline phosphatase